MLLSIQKILKIFKLESELDFENRAVVGGLERIFPSWEIDARNENLDDVLIQAVHEVLAGYRELDHQARSTRIKELIQKFHAYLQNQSTQISDRTSEIPNSDRSPGRQLPTSRKNFPIPQNTPNKTYTQTKQPADSNAAIGLNAPLTVLHGIGPRNAQLLNNLGLASLGDLLYYFPRRYDDYSQLKPINRITYGEELTVIAAVQSITTRQLRGGKLQITEVIVSDGTGFLRLNWFNQPWITTKLNAGTQIVISGKVDMYLGRLVINHPTWELVEQEHLHTNRIVPVYSLSGQITQQWLRRLMYQTVSFWAPRVQDYLPEEIRRAADLVDLARALHQIHFPDSVELLNIARSRLAFDEIFFLQLGVLRQKINWQSGKAEKYEMSEEWLNQHLQRLPFSLTGAQQQVLREIRQDLISGHPMNRLLQGDVGSGKTIIAALALAAVAHSGAQASIMAPTSILADQHYRNLSRLLSNPENSSGDFLSPPEIRLLIGDTPESEKKEIRDGLADGKIKIVIGTHALLEDPVIFKNLQLLVVDEQHRFGVAQRATLRAKGNNPHLLVMSATPIPRSLALTIYGDLDLSVMDEMPAGRQPVETHVLHPLERERAYRLISSQISEGHQAFIIYPLVEKGDDDDSKAAVEEHDRLQTEIFPQFKLGLLHGRLKPDEKERVMSQFRDQQYQILVSTSVVEVGVDIPNATIMVIEGANRFGLSQLHQFRGRVGRGTARSYCLLIPETEDAIENERLSAMVETNDGFVLAERDLQQRGPGDFLGTRQSGYSELKMASLTDIRLIEKARHQAQLLFEKDPSLKNPENSALEKTLHRFWSEGSGDVS